AWLRRLFGANAIQQDPGDRPMARRPDLRRNPVELTLVGSSGPLSKPGEPEMLCRFMVIPYPPASPPASISVLVRDRQPSSWQEYNRQLDGNQTREILECLEELGLPGRQPGVIGVDDTSDRWTHLLLHCRADYQTTTIDVDMLCGKTRNGYGSCCESYSSS